MTKSSATLADFSLCQEGAGQSCMVFTKLGFSDWKHALGKSGHLLGMTVVTVTSSP